MIQINSHRVELNEKQFRAQFYRWLKEETNVRKHLSQIRSKALNDDLAFAVSCLLLIAVISMSSYCKRP